MFIELSVYSPTSPHYGHGQDPISPLRRGEVEDRRNKERRKKEGEETGEETGKERIGMRNEREREREERNERKNVKVVKGRERW